MSPGEWQLLADRIAGLWPPRLDGNSLAAYYEVLESFSMVEVRAAVDTLSRTTREKRPPAGVLYSTVRAAQQRQDENKQAPNHDVLTPVQHRFAQIEIAQHQSPEHARRMKAVLTLGRRLSFATLATLLPLTACSAEEFNRRLAQLAGGREQPLQAAATERRRPGRTLLGTDPEGDDW